MPGLVGLNNMKANDYANVIIQVACQLLGASAPCMASLRCCVMPAMIHQAWW